MGNYDRIGELVDSLNSLPVERIVDLRIREMGDNKRLCPFHDDHKPDNFKIIKKYNKWQCFACGIGGNGIKFIMEYDGVEFKEAVIRTSYELNLISFEESEVLRGKNQNKKENTNQKINKNRESKVVKSTFVNNIGTPQELNSVYEIFSLGYSLIEKDKLTKEHKEEIQRKRYLNNDEIELDGYFTFPDMSIMDALIIEMEKRNISLDLLKKIPGFYYSVSKKKWCFTVLRGTSGIGIPIKDFDGNIVAIQIRLDEVSEKSKRYQWFSSSFANSSGKEQSKSKNIYGTSPGAPIAVVKPEKVKYKTIFITEGFFKARTIAKHYQSYAVSVQGVTNWKNIVETIDDMINKGVEVKCVYIAFDGDMCRKDTVMKPAIKMAFALTNLDYPEEMENILDKILKSSNRSVKEKVGTFRKNNEEIISFLKKNEQNFSTKIDFLLWNEMLGKGMDDILNTEFAKETIRPMDFITFWENAFNLLEELDDIREKMSIEQNVPFRKVVVGDDVKQSLFKKHIDTKLID